MTNLKDFGLNLNLKQISYISVTQNVEKLNLDGYEIKKDEKYSFSYYHIFGMNKLIFADNKIVTVIPKNSLFFVIVAIISMRLTALVTFWRGA